MADTVAAPATPSTTLVNPFIWGVGRRKSAVARVRVRPGSGKFIINKRELDEYFKLIPDREAARATVPIELGRLTNLVGTDAEIADRLERHASVGITTVLAKLAGPGDEQLRTVERLLPLLPA